MKGLAEELHNNEQLTRSLVEEGSWEGNTIKTRTICENRRFT